MYGVPIIQLNARKLIPQARHRRNEISRELCGIEPYTRKGKTICIKYV